jgi:hypothetical protein
MGYRQLGRGLPKAGLRASSAGSADHADQFAHHVRMLPAWAVSSSDALADSSALAAFRWTT